ncbi:MAG: dihydroorotate dehydrogenase electron transfer subunit [Planctomycetota bacterium]
MDISRHEASGSPVHRAAAPVVAVTARAGGHCRLRLRAPAIAADARPGQFVNVAPPLATTLLRRPLGVHRAIDGRDIELLFKAVGKGTIALAAAREGDELDVIGPLGNGFDLEGDLPETAVLVAGGFGLAPLYPLAAALRGRADRIYLFVGTEEDLPLETSDSRVHLSFVDPDVKVTLPDFEALGARCRVATLGDRPGFYKGLVTELVEKLLAGSEPLGRTKLYGCGPWAMLKKTAAIAREHGLDCDVLVEERMGCGIGACMSCAVLVHGDDGRPVYVRACVEGPVFDARSVVWDAK